MRFIINRVLLALLTLLAVSFLCFIVFSVISGDPASLLLGIEASEAQLDTLREELGLNHNVIYRYFQWLSAFCKGNAGNSIRFYGAPVSDLIKQRLPVSAALALMSLTFILIIAIPVSLFTVRHRESREFKSAWLDRIINTLVALNISVPNFFLGILFIWIFGIGFRLFSPGIYIDYRDSFSGFIAGLCFPALAIALPNAALLIKFLRTSKPMMPQ